MDQLIAEGDLSADWRETFLAVPRHLFIPGTVWQRDLTIDGPNDLVPVHRRESPEEWLEIAYANRAVTVQVDDGQPLGPQERGRDISSSASHPGVVAQMLAASGAQPGERVLEIGTGTGYNTALLAHRLGAHHVVSVEIDGALAEQAQRALTVAGYGAVTILTGDGALGHRERAPYDRVLSTASVRHVPHAWVSQTRPGGRILTPWANAYFDGGLLDDDDHGTLWLIDPGSGAWASLRHHPASEGPYEVRQSGTRRLWDEVEAAYQWWRDVGAPTAADWRFIITADTQRVELATSEIASGDF